VIVVKRRPLSEIVHIFNQDWTIWFILVGFTC